MAQFRPSCLLLFPSGFASENVRHFRDVFQNTANNKTCRAWKAFLPCASTLLKCNGRGDEAYDQCPDKKERSAAKIRTS